MAEILPVGKYWTYLELTQIKYFIFKYYSLKFRG